MAGLNSEYDSIRIQILSKDPLSSLNEVYSYVQEEEDHRHAMLSPPLPPSTEKSVFISSVQRGGRGGSHDRGVVVKVVSQGMTEINSNVNAMAGSDIQRTPVGIYIVVPRSFRVVLLNKVHILGGVEVLNY